jgi:hypothetical protein
MSQTVLLVSKAHQQSVKRLYKIIFQLHKSLPGELKQIGNSYVSREFKLHKNASPEHTQIFMREWSVILYRRERAFIYFISFFFLFRNTLKL